MGRKPLTESQSDLFMVFGPGEIIGYRQMYDHEDASLQRGMNYRLNPSHSVVLMSVRAGAPYDDEIQSVNLPTILGGLRGSGSVHVARSNDLFLKRHFLDLILLPLLHCYTTYINRSGRRQNQCLKPLWRLKFCKENLSKTVRFFQGIAGP